MTNVFRAQTLDDALDKLSELVKKSAENERNLVFCEDRITLLAERAVLRGTGGATFTTEVTTFARYLSGREVKRISKEGSVMKISELILDGKTQDGCFNNGSARAVYETIAQLSASNVDENVLLSAAASEEADGLLGRKLKDLARIYGAYRAFLGESGRVDENGYLALLKDAIEGDALENVNVFFFAFPSFTLQAMEGVRAAFPRAKSVTGIFIGGDAPIYTNRAATRFASYAAEAEGVPVKAILQPDAAVACTLTEDAKLLRDLLCAPAKRAAARADKITVFEAEDETREAETVAALVKKKISEGMRYRDLAVLVSGEEYFLTVEKTFSAYGIPLYAEKKRKLSSHPFAEYVLNVLNAVADGVLPDEADAIAGSVCFGEADEYRNYLLRYGAFRGAVNLPVKEGQEVGEYDREKLLGARVRMKEVLSLFKPSGRGKDYTDGVRQLFRKTNWKTVQERVEAAAGEDGLSAAERNFLGISLDEGSSFASVLDEIELVAGERRFGAREFSVILKNGLDALGVSMIPPCLDVVFVGDATESRFNRVKALFVMGLTDAVPRTGQDTAIITDGEIGRLKEIRVEIEPAIAEVNRRARESLVMNLCAFEKELYLSRPLQLRGSETEKSEVLRVLQDSGKTVSTAPMPDLYPFDCVETMPARLKMAFAKPDGSYVGDEALYETLKEYFGEEVSETESGDRATPHAAALWLREGRIAPTTLESYFECPYHGFGMRGLRLKERREGSVRAADSGTFVHTVLERTAKEFNGIADEEQLLQCARREAETLLTEPRYRAVADTKAGEYAGERLIAESCAVADAAWKQLIASRFRVRTTEEGVELTDVNVKGDADRIDDSDDYVRVVDYKTGRIDDSGAAYYTGRKLQLQLYLLAASEGKKPAGAFYFPAADPYKNADEEKFRMKGFYSAEDDVVTRLDPALGEGEKSSVFAGTRGKFSDKAMPEEDFRLFLGYSKLVAEQAEEEMKGGNVKPSPYEKSCEYCKLLSLCGFTGECRKERDVSCKDVVKIVRDRNGG